MARSSSATLRRDAATLGIAAEGTLTAGGVVGAGALPVWGPEHPLRREASKWVSWAGAAAVLFGLALSQLWREHPQLAVAMIPHGIPIDITNIGEPPRNQSHSHMLRLCSTARAWLGCRSASSFSMAMEPE